MITTVIFLIYLHYRFRPQFFNLIFGGFYLLGNLFSSFSDKSYLSNISITFTHLSCYSYFIYLWSKEQFVY